MQCPFVAVILTSITIVVDCGHIFWWFFHFPFSLWEVVFLLPADLMLSCLYNQFNGRKSFLMKFVHNTNQNAVSNWCTKGHTYLLTYLHTCFSIPPWAPEVAVPSDQWNGESSLCPICPYFNSPKSCILGGWPLCLEWASIGTAIAPQGSLWRILL